jgi:hypothetical protein
MCELTTDNADFYGATPAAPHNAIARESRLCAAQIILKYSEEHPAAVLQALKNRIETLIRELEKKDLEARGELRREPPREAYADVTPF